jgi:hypothetical protein
MVADRVAEFVERFKAAGLTGTPCTPADVEKLETKAAVRFADGWH